MIIKAGGEANCQKNGQINIVFMIMMIINIDFDDHQHWLLSGKSTLISIIINIDYYQENEWWQRCASSTIRYPPVLPPTQLPLERGEHNDGGDDWWRWWWWLWCHFPQTGLKIRKPDTEESSTAMASVIVIFLLLIVLLFIVLIIMYGDSKIT